MLSPHAKQLEVHLNKSRWKVLNWGRRSGKSVLSMDITCKEALIRQGLYYIVAPTYKEAKSIYWELLKLNLPKAAIKAVNETELSLTIHHLKDSTVTLPDGEKITVNHDPDKPNSRIILKGADNPDSLRGVGLSGVVLDEFAFMDKGPYIWDKILEPALADNMGWAIFISTPNGIQNHWYGWVNDKKKDWFYSRASVLDNPHFPIDEFNRKEQEAKEHGMSDAFAQEWLAEFVNPSRLVYAQFTRKDHVIKPIDVPTSGTYIIGIDFGWTDPFAVVFILVDKDNNWYIYDEIYETELPTQKRVATMLTKMGDNYFSKIKADSADPTQINELKIGSIHATPAKKGKGTIAGGIAIINSMLTIREGTGKPKLFVTENCKNTIKEFESYSNLIDAYGDVIDTPEDDNNHAMDALRYAALEGNPATARRKKRVRKYDKHTGRALS